MSIGLVPFTQSHLLEIDLGEHDRDFLATHGFGVGGVAQWDGRAETIVEDGRPLGVIGIGIEKQVAYPWLLLSDRLRDRYWLTLHRCAKYCIAGLMNRSDVTRIEAVAYNDFTQGCQWLERLGFTLVEQDFGLRRYVYG